MPSWQARDFHLYYLHKVSYEVEVIQMTMADYRIHPENGLEVGIYTLGDRMPDPTTGKISSEKQRIDELVEEATYAEQAGLDYYGLGESHQQYFTNQAHTVILGAIANATQNIKIGSAASIVSTTDPVRLFEDFATLDLLSDGRAEIVGGRASRLGIFDLLGYKYEDYAELFEEKFDLLLQIAANERVTWSGKFRAPLNDIAVYPRPLNGKMPIWRAVGGPAESAIKAGRAGVPMVITTLAGPVSRFKESVDIYRDVLRKNGYDPAEIPVTTAGLFYVAEDMTTALREYYPHVDEGMRLANGYGFDKRAFAAQRDPLQSMNVGDPEAVVEKVLYQYEQFGMQRYIAQLDFAGMPHKQVMRQIDYLGEKIVPVVKQYTRAYPKK